MIYLLVLKCNSSAPPPDLPHPFGSAQGRQGGGNVFPRPLWEGLGEGGNCYYNSIIFDK